MPGKMESIVIASKECLKLCFQRRLAQLAPVHLSEKIVMNREGVASNHATE